MRILFLLTQSLDSPGGGGRYLPLAKALTRKGYQVTMVALHHDFAHAERKHFVQDQVEIIYAGQMHVFKSGNKKEYYGPLKLLWVTAVATLALTWYALRLPCDAIHVCKTQPMNGFAARVAHLFRRIPIFLDSDDYEASNNRFSHPWQQKIVAWFEDWMPSFASGITAGNHFIADRFQRLGYPAERMVIVPNGVDREQFAILDAPQTPQALINLKRSFGLTKGTPLIVYVGTLSLVSHAVDLMLEAFADVIQEIPDANLLIVGGGEDFDKLQQLAQQLDLTDHVHFAGKVPAAEVPLYYRLADVTLDPRRRSLEAESSLSLKLVESIVAGVPCITADVGDRRQLAGDTALVVPPDDAPALTTAMLQALKDSQLQTRMREAIQAVRETHFWDERVDLFARIYSLANCES